jgi:hypothetical protein
MGNIAPMLGAILGISKTPKGEDKKRAVKPKGNKTTRGEKSVTEPAQQHGELSSASLPKPLSDKKLMKESAKHAARHATESWVSGNMSTSEHKAIHERAKHIMKGKEPREFKGTNGERSFKKMHGL